MRREDKYGYITVKFKRAQYEWLLNFLNREWDDETCFRLDEGAHDASYLKDILGVYKALLGNPKDFIGQLVYYDDLKHKIMDIKEVEGEPFDEDENY